MVAVAQRALGPRLTLVTDAVAALGMPPGRHTLGRAEMTVGDDGVRLADGTLAGSALSLDQAVRNLVAFTRCPTEMALHAASTAAAELLGDTARGTLAPGARADLVVLTRDLEVVMTVVAGRIAYDTR
jgi:N-acetylglucosamine-6-phosphate deacetylase